MDGHSWWPLFENIPTEYLEAYYPLRVDGYTTVTDSGGAGPPPRRQRGREALRVPRARSRLDPRRPLAHAAVGRARRAAGRALGEDPAPRRRDRAGAPGQVRRDRGGAGRHADLPDRGRRRVEGPAGPAGRGGRARRGLRARVGRGRVVRRTAWSSATLPRPRPSGRASGRSAATRRRSTSGRRSTDALASCLEPKPGSRRRSPAKPLRWSPLEDRESALARARGE